MKKQIRFIKLVLVILTLLFIWGNSMLPADLSSIESGVFQELLEPVLTPIQRVLAELGYNVSQSQIVRKMAHFTEYMVLGALMCFLFAGPDGRGHFFLSEFLCLDVALVDEVIQIFSEGRGPSLRDVAIDFTGATLGVIAVSFILLFMRLRWWLISRWDCA